MQTPHPILNRAYRRRLLRLITVRRRLLGEPDARWCGWCHRWPARYAHTAPADPPWRRRTVTLCARCAWRARQGRATAGYDPARWCPRLPEAA
jgi:hypothetical protein